MKWTLPNCPVHIARHPFPSRQTPHCYLVKLPSPLHLVDCPNEASKLPKKIFWFWAVQGLIFLFFYFFKFFLVCQKFCLKKSNCPWFLFCLDPPFLSLSLSLSFFFVWIYSSLRLERKESFQNSDDPLNYFLNILRTKWKISTSNFMFSLNSSLWMMNYEFEAIVLEWKFIHENLWNLRMKQSSSQNNIYNFISFIKCG